MDIPFHHHHRQHIVFCRYYCAGQADADSVPRRPFMIQVRKHIKMKIMKTESEINCNPPFQVVGKAPFRPNTREGPGYHLEVHNFRAWPESNLMGNVFRSPRHHEWRELDLNEGTTKYSRERGACKSTNTGIQEYRKRLTKAGTWWRVYDTNSMFLESKHECVARLNFQAYDAGPRIWLQSHDALRNALLNEWTKLEAKITIFT